MRKQSAPVLIDHLNEENIADWVSELKACGMDRVFLCGIGEFYSSEESINRRLEKCVRVKPILEDAGIEVGVWINGFGHGIADITLTDEDGQYQGFVGEDGTTPGACFCPSDEGVKRDYAAFVTKIAKTVKPTVLMIDDDFRMGQRGYSLGCFCPNHIADISKRLGEKISREQLVKLAFSGKPNRYRDAYIDSMNDTLRGFARMLRECVDKVHPTMRMGVAMCFDVWDTDGIDAIGLAKDFAGNTRPFLRANGAPYWQIFSPNWNNMWGDIISTIEYNRLQSAWCIENGIECIAEGDTYPRPRYTIPANHLEIFDLALVANGEVDEMLKYMFDYRHGLGFEDGYTKRHKKNQKSREMLSRAFEGKRAVGVRIFEQMRKLRESDLGEQYDGWSRDILYSFFSRAQYPIAHNGISTVYYDGAEGAVAAFGENARHLPTDLMKRGVITDAVGARILSERGIDSGYVSSEYASYINEQLPDGNLIVFEKVTTCKLECACGAEVTSVFLPDKSVASYRYENADGVKFFVLGYDSYRTPPYIIAPDYMLDYNRQRQIIDAVEWIDGKPLYAKSYKNPFLYISTYLSDEDGSLAVGLFNVFADSVYECEIILDREYKSVSFIGCDGELSGNVVKLSGEIPPYGFAAFELKLN